MSILPFYLRHLYSASPLDNGKAQYTLQILSTDATDILEDDRNDYKSLEQAHLRIYYYVYRKENFLDTGFTAQDIRSKGRAEGGVRVYLDGFRVFPYGDPGDDWLQLDEYANRNVDLARSINPPTQVVEIANSLKPERPFLLIPKNYQLFGVVAISQAIHTSIQTNVSRERLIDSPTVTQLRRFVQNGIYWMTMKYAATTAETRGQRRKKRIQTVPQIIREAKDTLAALAVEETSSVKSTEPSLPVEDPSPVAGQEIIKTVDQKLDQAIEQATAEAAEHISELSLLRLLASAGTTLTLMNHQLQALTGAVSQTEQDLHRLRPQVPNTLHVQYDDITAQVTEWHEMVTLQVSQLGVLLSPDSRQRRRRHVLYEIVENVKKPMLYYMKKYGVRFENLVPRDMRTPPIYQAELYAVLLSVFSNALKAVYGQPIRAIAVTAIKTNKSLQLQMMDTGVGLATNRREISFDPFVTTSIPNPVLGVGTGLGLTIVRDILEEYNGTARFVDTERPWRTCIEINLPDRGVSDD